jgi:hypothetical protein
MGKLTAVPYRVHISCHTCQTSGFRQPGGRQQIKGDSLGAKTRTQSHNYDHTLAFRAESGRSYPTAIANRLERDKPATTQCMYLLTVPLARFCRRNAPSTGSRRGNPGADPPSLAQRRQRTRLARITDKGCGLGATGNARNGAAHLGARHRARRRIAGEGGGAGRQRAACAAVPRPK